MPPKLEISKRLGVRPTKPQRGAGLYQPLGLRITDKSTIKITSNRGEDDSDEERTLQKGGGGDILVRIAPAAKKRVSAAELFAHKPPALASDLGNDGDDSDTAPANTTNIMIKLNMSADEAVREVQQREARSQRFTANLNSNTISPLTSRPKKRARVETTSAPPRLVGTCTNIEREYLRLTKAPDPSQVRPPRVLIDSLKHVQKMWRQNKNYNYVCEQMKSIRQDLVVQHIETMLTVRVYEVHARVALEVGDLAEFNQCQSQLHSLYTKVSGGSTVEFTAYKLLYLLIQKKISSLAWFLSTIPEYIRTHDHVQHAIKVCLAVQNNNHRSFFKLYKTAPDNHSSYLLSSLLPAVRVGALRAIVMAYFPSISVDDISDLLGFGVNTFGCLEFLSQNKIVCSDDFTVVDIKLSRPAVMAAVNAQQQQQTTTTTTTSTNTNTNTTPTKAAATPQKSKLITTHHQTTPKNTSGAPKRVVVPATTLISKHIKKNKPKKFKF